MKEQQPAKKTIVIANLIDWSRSFVDEKGSFYCGTTDEQKKNAASVAELADLVISSTDLHPLSAPEFKINGGLYPVHNLPRTKEYERGIRLAGEIVDLVMVDPHDPAKPITSYASVNPSLTVAIDDTLKGRKTGVLMPREVYFQGPVEALESDYLTPFCSADDVEATFGAKLITTPDEFFSPEGGDFTYIIAPKRFFDATRLDGRYNPSRHISGIPDMNFNIFSLLKGKYPSKDYNLVFINTGVVEGICRLHTSVGMRQMFPNDRIINVADATTPLYGIGLGYSTPQESREACARVCKDIGVEYKTTVEVLNEFKK